MANYDFRTLSPVEFETLVRDLLQKELEVTLEAFTTGRDQGIDLRYARDPNQLLIIQCKHYADTGYEGLYYNLKNKEVRKVNFLEPKRYIIATSVGLTPSNKTAIMTLFPKFIQSPADIYGRDDLNNLLGKFPDIEEHHHKLWLTSKVMLERILRSGIYLRSAATIESIEKKIKLYVPNPSFQLAQEILREAHVCIIAGIPGIGKTMLTEMLLIDHYQHDYQIITVSSDIDEAWDSYKPDIPQMFYYDDFLGQGSITDKLSKNEDTRLLEFIDFVTQNVNKRFVLTTREYILAQAKMTYEKLAGAKIELNKLVLDLEVYSRYQRAKILYNHIYFSELPREVRNEFLKGRRYARIADHKNYSPRLIETITRLASTHKTLSEDSFEEFVFGSLDNPVQLWSHAFDNQISSFARSVLLALATLPTETTLEVLKAAVLSLNKKLEIAGGSIDFLAALKLLEGTFLRLEKARGKECAVSFHNPSVRDFIITKIVEDTDLVNALLDSALFFDQVRFFWQRTEIDEENLSMEECSYAEHLWRAVQRTINSPIVRLVVAQTTLGHVSRWLTADPLEARLLQSIEIAGALSPSDGIVWLEAQIKACITLWNQNKGSKDSAKALIKKIQNKDIISESIAIEAQQAAHKWFLETLDSLDSFEDAMAMIDILNQIKEPGALSLVRDRFIEKLPSIVLDIISSKDTSSQLSEASNRLKQVARKLRRNIGKTIIEIESKVSYLESQEEARAERYEEDYETDPDDDEKDKDTVLDALFDSLRE